MSEVRTYSGSCHCGAVRFRFRSEELATGIRCNCSICQRRGAVMSSRYYAPEELEVLQGLESLSLYRFGDALVNHWFCKRCGIHPFAEVTETPRRYRVNLGCVEGVDPLALDITLIDGRSF